MIGLLRTLQRAASQRPLEPSAIRIGGGMLAVVFRRHAQARRLVLRLSHEGTSVLVTVPKGVSRLKAIEFTERSRGWIEERMRARGGNIHLRPGHQVPLRGDPHEIVQLNSRRGTVKANAALMTIEVPGDHEHVPRRLLDWLKAQARADLVAASEHYAARMGVKFRRVSIRDQKGALGLLLGRRRPLRIRGGSSWRRLCARLRGGA